MKAALNHPALNTQITDQPAVYVGTYAKYNNGSIFGKWIDLTEVSSKEEFYQLCADIHSDENDPEFMFQDYQSIPEGVSDLIGESWLSDDFFERFELAVKLENMDESGWVDLNNQYCRNNKYEDEIYSFDDDFFNVFFQGSPMEAAKAASFGDLNWGHDYIRFNGYGNLESTDRPLNWIDTAAISKHVTENPDLYYI